MKVIWSPFALHQRKETAKYRSIVISKQNKLVYYVEGDNLYIAALWDTRREPRAQADNTK